MSKESLKSKKVLSTPMDKKTIPSKAERQKRFNAACENMSSEESVNKASIFGEINPSDFKIVRMIG